MFVIQIKNYFAITMLILFSGLSAQTNYSPAAGNNSFREIILSQYHRYPQMELQDLYKFVFQSVFGAGHAAADSVKVRAWLTDEWSSTTPDSCEPVAEPVRPDGKLSRINIAAYKINGGSMENLLNAFLSTIRMFKPMPGEFNAFSEELFRMADAKEIPANKDQLSKFIKKMRSDGLPAVHHSNSYRKLYKPAYRIVLTELLPQPNR